MRLALLLAVLPMGFAPAPFLKRAERDPGAADLKSLQGEWVQLPAGGPGGRSETTNVYDGNRLVSRTVGNGTAAVATTLLTDAAVGNSAADKGKPIRDLCA